jgi:hypothetical protein
VETRLGSTELTPQPPSWSASDVFPPLPLPLLDALFLNFAEFLIGINRSELCSQTGNCTLHQIHRMYVCMCLQLLDSTYAAFSTCAVLRHCHQVLSTIVSRRIRLKTRTHSVGSRNGFVFVVNAPISTMMSNTTYLCVNNRFHTCFFEHYGCVGRHLKPFITLPSLAPPCYVFTRPTL